MYAAACCLILLFQTSVITPDELIQDIKAERERVLTELAEKFIEARKELRKMVGAKLNPRAQEARNVPGEEPYSYRTAQSRDSAIVDKANKQAVYLNGLLVQFTNFEHFPKMDLRSAKKGQYGIISTVTLRSIAREERSPIERATVFQVFGKEDLIAEYNDINFWISGLSTENVTDQSKISVAMPMICLGTKSYTTAVGGSRTIFWFTPLKVPKEVAGEVTKMKEEAEKKESQSNWFVSALGEIWEDKDGTKFEALLKESTEGGYVFEMGDGTAKKAVASNLNRESFARFTAERKVMETVRKFSKRAE